MALTQVQPQMSAGGPAFSAYQSSNQTLSTATWTKVTIDIEEFDTNNNFASSRFTPTIAGYYLCTGAVSNGGNNSTTIALYKNGTEYKRGNNISANYTTQVTGLVYCNGSTDYVELYTYFATGTTTGASAAVTYFQASMIRSA